MGVVCASKLKFGVVLPSCLCGGVTMSSLVWWFPWWGCGVLSRCVCVSMLCVVCDLGGGGLCLRFVLGVCCAWVCAVERCG